MSQKNNPDQKPRREGNAGQRQPGQPNQSDPTRREVQPPGEQSGEKKKNPQRSEDEQREERKRQEREKSSERRP